MGEFTTNLDQIFLISNNQDSPVECIFNNGSLAMKKHNNPLSIRENEFQFLKNFIVEHNLTKGYELATAFGISTTACGLGFKETHGKLCSMDSYIEETVNYCGGYNLEHTPNFEADGYKLADFLITKFGLQDTVSLYVGKSPDDVDKLLLHDLDFIFIDALHTDQALLSDFNAIFKYMANKCVLFLHDMHCFRQDTIEYIQSLMHNKFIYPPSCSLKSGGGYNLSYIWQSI